MLLKTLENSILNDFTYYHITIFDNANKPGRDYENAYKTEKNATKAAQRLIDSGNYELIVLRREEVISQIPHKEYYSINSPIRSFIKEDAKWKIQPLLTRLSHN